MKYRAFALAALAIFLAQGAAAQGLRASGASAGTGLSRPAAAPSVTRATLTSKPSMPRASEVGEYGVTDSASTWA